VALGLARVLALAQGQVLLLGLVQGPMQARKQVHTLGLVRGLAQGPVQAQKLVHMLGLEQSQAQEETKDKEQAKAVGVVRVQGLDMVRVLVLVEEADRAEVKVTVRGMAMVKVPVAEMPTKNIEYATTNGPVKLKIFVTVFVI
jgi:hypothetical protein